MPKDAVAVVDVGGHEAVDEHSGVVSRQRLSDCPCTADGADIEAARGYSLHM